MSMLGDASLQGSLFLSTNLCQLCYRRSLQLSLDATDQSHKRLNPRVDEPRIPLLSCCDLRTRQCPRRLSLSFQESFLPSRMHDLAPSNRPCVLGNDGSRLQCV